MENGRENIFWDLMYYDLVVERTGRSFQPRISNGSSSPVVISEVLSFHGQLCDPLFLICHFISPRVTKGKLDKNWSGGRRLCACVGYDKLN